MKEYPILFSAPMVQANHAGRKRMTRRVVALDQLKVIMRKEVRPDFPLNTLQKFKDTVARAGSELKAKLNSAGAVSCLTPGGELALRPGEFDFVCPYAQGETIWAKKQGQNTWTIVPQNSFIWVRETWRIGAWKDELFRFACDYKASPEETSTPWIEVGAQEWREKLGKIYTELSNIKYPTEDGRYQWEHGKAPLKWRPSIHMPRWACRDVYTVTKVRLERLHAILESRDDALGEGIEPHPEHPGYFKSSTSDTGYCTAVGAFTSLWESINGKREGCTWDDNPWVWVIEYDNPLWRKV